MILNHQIGLAGRYILPMKLYKLQPCIQVVTPVQRAMLLSTVCFQIILHRKTYDLRSTASIKQSAPPHRTSTPHRTASRSRQRSLSSGHIPHSSERVRISRSARSRIEFAEASLKLDSSFKVWMECHRQRSSVNCSSVAISHPSTVKFEVCVIRFQSRVVTALTGLLWRLGG